MLTITPERRSTLLATLCVATEAVNRPSRVDVVIELAEAEHCYPLTVDQKEIELLSWINEDSIMVHAHVGSPESRWRLTTLQVESVGQ